MKKELMEGTLDMARALRLTVLFLSVAGIVCSLCMLASMGCQQPHERLNSPPQGHTDRQAALQESFVYMSDNALLADMSMSSVHFVPHQSELNSLGARRLNRLAQILKIYGGTVRYDGTTDDSKLASDRIAQIKEYLLARGLEADRMEIKRAMAGGEGMNAQEAILIRQTTNFNPDSQQKGSEDDGSMLSSGSGSSSQSSSNP